MWKDCPKVLDEPIQILGLEWSDFVMTLGVFGSVTIWLNPFLGIPGGLAVGALLWWLKRDQPPGAIIHLLHRLEIWPIHGVFAPIRQTFSPW